MLKRILRNRIPRVIVTVFLAALLIPLVTSCASTSQREVIASDDEVFEIVLMADDNLRILDENGDIIGVIQVINNDPVLKFRFSGRLIMTRSLLVDAGFGDVVGE